jgi:autotransporter-associated beta strand protein
VRPSLILIAALAFMITAPAADAAYNVTISDSPTSGFDSTTGPIFSAIADDAVLNIDDLKTAILANSFVAVFNTSDGTQDGTMTLAVPLASPAHTGALVLLAGGDIGLNGAITMSGTSLTVQTDATITLNADVTITGGSQTYDDQSGAHSAHVVVTGTRSLQSVGGTSSVWLYGSVDGPGALSVSAGNAVQFNDAVGGARPLASLSVTGTTDPLAAGVTVVGDISFAALAIAGTVPITSTAGSIDFNGAVNGSNPGAGNLTATANAAGETVSFDQGAGLTTSLQSVTTSAPDTVLGANVRTTGNQSYGPMALTGDRAFNAGSGNVTFGALNGAQTLTVNATGATTFGAAVGGSTPLTSVTTNPLGTTSVAGSISTSGAQSYGEAVTLTGDAIFTSSSGGDVTFGSTLDGAGRSASIATAGLTTFAAPVGGTSPLASLTTNATGSTTIAGATVATSGDQTYDDSVTLSGGGKTLTSSGGAITMNATGAFGTGSHVFSAFGLSDVSDFTGSGSLTKEGAGTLRLNAGTQYTGDLVIAAGRLDVLGDSSASDVQLGGGTLGGTGTVGAVSSTAGGALSPGLSPGRLFTGGVALDASSSLVAELDGTAAGTGYDQLSATGTVALGGAGLTVTPGFGPAAGDTFVLIANDGADPVTGTFAGRPEASTFTAGGMLFRIFYAAGDGNDVAVRRLVIPNVTVTASPVTPSTVGTPVTFAAAVAGATGSVSFSVDGAAAGTTEVSGGAASVTVSNLGAGSHEVIASYGGDANHGAATSAALTHVVNTAPAQTSPTPTPAPTPIDVLPPALVLSGVSAKPVCLAPKGVKRQRAGKDIAFAFVMSEAANLRATVQRRTRPAGRATSSCPARLAPTTGERFATVRVRAGGKTVPLAAAVAAVAGKQRLKLSRIVGGRRLAPGRYRLVLQPSRADRVTPAVVTVAFAVLAR